MVRRPRTSPRFSLSPHQRTTILEIADRLRPDLRHSFVLRVERCLHVSTTGSSPTDALVSRAIDKALNEVPGGR